MRCFQAAQAGGRRQQAHGCASAGQVYYSVRSDDGRCLVEKLNSRFEFVFRHVEANGYVCLEAAWFVKFVGQVGLVFPGGDNFVRSVSETPTVTGKCLAAAMSRPFGGLSSPGGTAATW